MTRMTDEEMLAKVIAADGDAYTYRDQLRAANNEVVDFYNSEPWNEVDGRSSVNSTDVQDVVEADMPSLVRIFLGSKDIITFIPNTSSEAEKAESDEKTAYVSHLIRNQPNSFKLIHDWMKTAEIKKFGVVRYDYVEESKPFHKTYEGLSEEERFALRRDFEDEQQRTGAVVEFKKEEQEEDGTWVLEVKIERTKKTFPITYIPTDNFVISRNASSKYDAELIGDDTLMSRSELIAAGFDKDKVMSLPRSSTSATTFRENTYSGTFRQSGFNKLEKQTSDINAPANELIAVKTRYVLIDKDGDGISERRRVVYAGDVLLDDMPFDHVPYAILSSILMPDEAIGKSRGEITVETNKVKSTLVRGMMDNTYMVNSGRTVVNTQLANVDDLLTNRHRGIVRTKGDPRASIAALDTPYVADKTLQVIQYLDFARGQRTGTLMASQGVTSDQVNNETATRFNGVRDEGEAKVELVARNFAETGFSELYEGLAWMASHFNVDETEIMVLGKPMTVNPSMWRFDHSLVSKVGLGTGDNAEVVNNMLSVFNIQSQLLAQGSPLADSTKQYNALDAALKAMDQKEVDRFFNNPEVPDELVQQTIEQLNNQLGQAMSVIEQNINNPLLQAEQLRAQIKQLEIAQKDKDSEQKNQIDAAKVAQDSAQFQQELKEEQRQFNAQLLTKINELEAKFRVDLANQIPKEGGNNE